jgi:hypothetical protein
VFVKRLSRRLILYRRLLQFSRLRCVMKWIKERDALIAQTMAFVQSVSGGKEAVSRFEPRLNGAVPAKPQAELEPVAPVPMKVVEIPKAVENAKIVEIPGPPKNVPLSRQFDQVDVKTEIQARIAGFRAHQERFNRERHEYFNATLARLRASMDQPPPPRREK